MIMPRLHGWGGVIVSNNDCTNDETKSIVDQFINMWPAVSYHENERNIGIDSNHEKVYEYSTADYVLFLADDDILLAGGLETIEEYLISRKADNLLFAISNSLVVKNGVIAPFPVYNNMREIYTVGDLKEYMFYDKPKNIFPLLPYFGGVVVNVQMMKALSTKIERSRFDGTFHQYIGCLWKVGLCNSDVNAGFISEPIICVGCDSDKTWFEYKDDVLHKLLLVYKELDIDKLSFLSAKILIKFGIGRLSRFYGVINGILKKIHLFRVRQRGWKR